MSGHEGMITEANWASNLRVSWSSIMINWLWKATAEKYTLTDTESQTSRNSGNISVPFTPGPEDHVTSRKSIPNTKQTTEFVRHRFAKLSTWQRSENVYCLRRANCCRSEKYKGIEWKRSMPICLWLQHGKVLIIFQTIRAWMLFFSALLPHGRRAFQARNDWKIIKTCQCAELKGKWALTL